MEVKILKSVASPSYTYASGEKVKLDKARANEFIEYGIAEAITEKATKKAPVKKTSTKKKGDKDADDS